ncbi:hypothetical protein BH10PSE19_BH10PSE19_00400 [soil metagenome]
MNNKRTLLFFTTLGILLLPSLVLALHCPGKVRCVAGKGCYSFPWQEPQISVDGPWKPGDYLFDENRRNNIKYSEEGSRAGATCYLDLVGSDKDPKPYIPLQVLVKSRRYPTAENWAKDPSKETYICIAKADKVNQCSFNSLGN